MREHYIIRGGDDPTTLARLVNREIDDGYELLGAPFTGPGPERKDILWFFQALVSSSAVVA